MLAQVLAYLFPGIDFTRDVAIQEGVGIVEWRRPEPQPTQAEIDAAAPAAQAALDAEEQAKAAQAKRDEIIKQAMNAFADSVLADKGITPTAAITAMKDAARAKVEAIAVAEVAAETEVTIKAGGL